MDQRIQRQLQPVAKRFRSVRLGRMLSVLWLALAAAGGCLLWLRDTYALPGETIILLSCAAGGSLLLVVFGLLSYRNLGWVAHQVEHAHPSLQERLLTAIEVRATTAAGNYGYLQHLVLQETLTHAHKNNWKTTVPFRRLAFAQLGNWSAFLLMFVILATLFAAPPAAIQPPTSPEAQPQVAAEGYQIAVEPGDTEIEKGSSLIVVARFAGQVPAAATLAYSAPASDGESRLDMSRSLDDPLFGGHLFSVEQDLVYRIEYAGEKTQDYRVTVFEYPLLIQADAKLHYPNYTKLQDKLVEDTRRVTAVEGTELTWTCHLNKRVDGAFLHDEEGNEIELFPANDESLAYSATIPLLESKRWKLYLIDAVGRENKMPPELSAKVLKNQPADVELALARDLRVSPVEEVEVQATTWDDFGIAKYGLTYTLAGKSQEVVLGEQAVAKERREANHLLDFERLEAQPDQLLSYYFWADDYAADGSSRRTMSDLFFAEVRHFEEIFRQGEQPPGDQQQQQQQQQQQSQNEQEAEQLAELQKQIVTGTWNVIRRETATQPTDKFAEDINLLIESQKTALEQTEALAEKLTDAQSQQFIEVVRGHMTDAITELTQALDDQSAKLLTPALAAEQAAYQSLLRLRAREHDVVQQQQSQSSSQSQSSQSQQNRFQQQLQQLELKNDENRYETQRQAEQQEDAEQREMRQVVNRLKELARRQEDLNEQVKQLQSALEEAESQEAREEIERQLKRLRDQQQQMLRDTDELAERMEQQQNQQSMQDAREQLEQTRESVQQASQALEQGQVAQALSAGTRAERELKRMRDDLRKETANQFTEEMKELRQAARELDDEQQELADRLQSMDQDRQQNLRDKSDRADIAKTLEGQQERLTDLLDKMKDTVEEAEATEPLLARKLYDSYREAKQRKVEQALEASQELLTRGLDPQSREIEANAREGISDLRDDIEQAAEDVLGDQTESLRRALSELNQLERELTNEIARANAQGNNDPNAENPTPGQGDPNQEGNPPQPNEGQPNEGQPNEGQPNRGNPTSPTPPNNTNTGESQPAEQPASPDGQGTPPPSDNNRPDNNREGENPMPSDQPGNANPQQNRPNTPAQGEQGAPSQPPRDRNNPTQPSPSPGNQPGQPASPPNPNQQPGNPNQAPTEGRPNSPQGDQGGLQQYARDSQGSAPITGADFRDWSDRLRDVEEMIDDPDLAAEAARIRDRARNFRVEFNRTGGEPKWNLVNQMVAQPLQELKQQVSNELLRSAADKNKLVPIDRDPVPHEYAEQVRKYYERLGVGQ